MAIVAASLLAAGLSNLKLLPGRPLPLAGIMQWLQDSSLSLSGFKFPFDIVRPLVACVWLLLIASIIGFIISPEIRKNVFKRVIIYTLWLLLFYGLITSLQPYFSLPQPKDTGPPGAGLIDPSSTIEVLPPPPDFIVNPPQWIVFAVSAFLLTLLLAIIWLFWYLFWAGKKNSSLDLLTQEAQQTLKNIQAGYELKDAVLRCYVEMSQILSKQRNIHRPQGMTPREFEEYLAQSGLRTEHIRPLTRLFESVRYGNQAPGQREEREAVACLTAIVKTYGQSS